MEKDHESYIYRPGFAPIRRSKPPSIKRDSLKNFKPHTHKVTTVRRTKKTVHKDYARSISKPKNMVRTIKGIRLMRAEPIPQPNFPTNLSGLISQGQKGLNTSNMDPTAVMEQFMKELKKKNELAQAELDKKEEKKPGFLSKVGNLALKGLWGTGAFIGMVLGAALSKIKSDLGDMLPEEIKKWLGKIIKEIKERQWASFKDAYMWIGDQFNKAFHNRLMDAVGGNFSSWKDEILSRIPFAMYTVIPDVDKEKGEVHWDSFYTGMKKKYDRAKNDIRNYFSKGKK